MSLEREITLVFGKTGMGKTQWTRQFLRTLKRVIVIDPISEYEGFQWCDDPKTLLEWTERYKVFRLRTASIDRFEDVCLVASVAGGCTLVLEEAQRIAPPHTPLPPTFEDIVYRGRHSRTSLVVVSQRPTTVNIVARSQWTRIIAFAQTEPADIGWLRSVSGSSDMFESLTQFEYFDILPTGTEKKLLTFSRTQTREGVSP